ncbi:MAG: hypothetical protein H6742_00130 [Alphaproteobacteria bacterium]|nr:hypothetical protein [Alphaproteobacteria bacterium]
MTTLILLLLLACAGDRDPCTEMCAAAAALYGDCLADQGADWTAAGYADADAFVGSCETWAVEMRLLERELDAAGWTDDICGARAERFRDGACTDFTGTDWNQMPGEDDG